VTGLRDLTFGLTTARGSFAAYNLIATPESSSACPAAMPTALRGMPAIGQHCGALT
jgi:hypothetical protein